MNMAFGVLVMMNFLMLVYLLDLFGKYTYQYQHHRDKFLESVASHATVRKVFMKVLVVWIVLSGAILLTLLVSGIRRSSHTDDFLSSLGATFAYFSPLLVTLVVMTGSSKAADDLATSPGKTLIKMIEMREIRVSTSNEQVGAHSYPSVHFLDVDETHGGDLSTRLESFALLSKSYSRKESLFENPEVAAQISTLKEKGLIEQESPQKPNGNTHDGTLLFDTISGSVYPSIY